MALILTARLRIAWLRQFSYRRTAGRSRSVLDKNSVLQRSRYENCRSPRDTYRAVRDERHFKKTQQPMKLGHRNGLECPRSKRCWHSKPPLRHGSFSRAAEELGVPFANQPPHSEPRGLPWRQVFSRMPAALPLTNAGRIYAGRDRACFGTIMSDQTGGTPVSAGPFVYRE